LNDDDDDDETKRRISMTTVKLPEKLQTLRGFKVSKILNDGKDSSFGNVVALLGTFPGLMEEEEESVVLKLSRPPIPLDDLDQLADAITLYERMPYSGMEYGYYHGVVNNSSETFFAPYVSVDVVYPGCLKDESKEAKAKLLAKHISRNQAQRPVIFRENPKAYENAHLPYIEAIPSSAIGWVHKILNKEKELERLLFDDDDVNDGFLLNTDPKWTTHPDPKTTPKEQWMNHPSTRELYCLGLCHRKDVRSLRDLRAAHLPMLRAMAKKGREVIKNTYGLANESLRIFVHYPPQFYHFHVHFTNVSVEHGVSVERAHLLDDVIENIERDSEHYAKRSITCRMGENDELWRRFKELDDKAGAEAADDDAR
jgi:m7GpppX diphosphatase